jgi:hypothetical protein
MTPIAWMAGASLLSWFAVTVVAGARVNPEALFGMAGPLAAAGATWIAVQRVHRAAPERLTGVLMAGFGLKVVWYGAYVAVMLRVLTLRPVPFMVSFTIYFIALYAMEALFLQRLTTDRPR